MIREYASKIDVVGHHIMDDKGNGMFKKEWYGQGMIYKNWIRYYGNSKLVCYIPDNEVMLSDDDVYTAADFLRIAKGNQTIADMLFECVDWQHPESVIEDWLACEEIVEDENGRLICNPENGYEDVFPLTANMVESGFESSNEEDNPFYVERWFDEDLVLALKWNGIEVNEENLKKMREAAVAVFSDKSSRFEMLYDAAYGLSFIGGCHE